MCTRVYTYIYREKCISAASPSENKREENETKKAVNLNRFTIQYLITVKRTLLCALVCW